MDFQPTESQEILIDKAVRWYRNWERNTSDKKQLFSFSGAAGTGKSTSARMIIDALQLGEHEYITCAYVGKAVLNLRKNGMNARTIHSLIYDARPVVDKNDAGKAVIKYRFYLKEKLDEGLKIIFIDEVGMVNDNLMKEIMSFNLPIIAFGDRNQLGPVMGEGSALVHPDHILNQIMRQNENDPIIYLSQMILKGIPIFEGEYGMSRVIRDLDFDSSLLTYNQIICNTNKLREKINDFIREDIMKYPHNKPMISDKVVCCQNFWNIILNNEYPLTNGMVGTLTNIDRSTTRRGYYRVDFAPDFLEGSEYVNLDMDMKYLRLTAEEKRSIGRTENIPFDWAYALTVYKSQGSEYDKVLFFDSFFKDVDTARRSRYTAITRAKKAITIVIGGNHSKLF